MSGSLASNQLEFMDMMKRVPHHRNPQEQHVDMKQQETIEGLTRTDVTTGDLVWIDLDLDHEPARDWLRSKAGLVPEMLEALDDEYQATQRLLIDDETFTLIHISVIDEDTRKSRILTISFIRENNRLISMHHGELFCAAQVHKDLELEDDPLTPLILEMMIIGEFCMVMDAQARRISDSLDHLEDAFNTYDEKKIVDSLGRMQRRILKLSRPLRPIITILVNQRTDPMLHLNADESSIIRQTVDRYNHYLGVLDGCRDRTTLLAHQLRDRATEKMSKAMYRLGIVGTVFLPLTFLTGLLGINVPVPGEQSPNAFWIVCVIAVSIAALSWILVVLRWRR